MELKYNGGQCGLSTLNGSNRTFMELKFRCRAAFSSWPRRSNRTFMELKCGEGTYAVKDDAF